MPERDGYIPGVPCWVDVNQPDPESIAVFYAGLFGWELEDVMPPDAGGNYFIGRINGRDAGAIGSIPEGAPPLAMWNTYVRVDSADETAEKVRAAGGQVLTEPFDVMDAGRMAVFADPAGAVFCVWQPGRHQGAGVVNEHGAVNFNTLSTRDVESAKAFYGSVFGWEVLDIGGGGQFWTLPGYVDHLEEIKPGTKEAFAEMGGPDGFEDVVAMISVLRDDEPDPPNWSVVFAVDDADAAAAKAYELGGKIIAPPFDAPWVRMTVISDPGGAIFVASQFVPENAKLGDQAEVSAA